MLERKADFIAAHEHKVREHRMKKIHEQMKEKCWTFVGAPCDESANKTATGAGGMAKDTIRMTKTPILTEAFKIAWGSCNVWCWALDGRSS